MSNYLYCLVGCIVTVISTFVAMKVASKEDIRYTLQGRYLKMAWGFCLAVCLAELLMAYIGMNFVGWYLAFGLIFGMLSVSATIDFMLKEMPDMLTLGSTVVALIYGYMYCVRYYPLTNRLMIAVLVFVIFTILALFIGGFGMGDAKLLFQIGFMTTPVMMIDYWLYALIPAVIHSVALLVLNAKKKDEEKEKISKLSIPFGPYLIFSYAVLFMFVY